MEEVMLSTDILASLTAVAVLFPLLSFLLMIIGKKSIGTILPLFSISISFISSIFIFLTIWNSGVFHEQWEWFTLGNKTFRAGILLNNLSVLMMMLVSGISLLVHIYSIAYMKGDPDLHKYWAYLGLFCSSMLGLVVSDSLLLVYIFWELVGFSSYLLIGFWHHKDAASQAAKKAFIMNRIGDLGFLAGIMIIYMLFGTLDIITLFGDGGLVGSATLQNGYWISGDEQLPEVWLTIAGLAFFLGAMAKSAQFPLHTWLPDAMEGPTSVSSLIHAATMVAAGVFLIARIYPLFDSVALNVITIIGALTAFMAATIALTQNDIKRILAYSTISQLGFMVAAMGIGAYGEALFHLSTHAFFKCLLFLGAGAVIHQLHHHKLKHQLEFDHQDVSNMGGLAKQMPLTFISMSIAAIALAGLPLTSGFLSKDAILISSFEWASGYPGWKNLVPYVLVISSWLTVFYIARLIVKVFLAPPRQEGMKEASSVMTVPMMILAVCCLFLTFSISPFSGEDSWLLSGFPASGVRTVSVLHWLVPTVVTLISIGIAFLTFKKYGADPRKASAQKGMIFRFSQQAWYIDRIHAFLFVRSTEVLSQTLSKFDFWIVDGLVRLFARLAIFISQIASWLDRYIVDGAVVGMATLAGSTGNFVRKFQTGKLQHYLISMLSLVVALFILSYLMRVIGK